MRVKSFSVYLDSRHRNRTFLKWAPVMVHSSAAAWEPLLTEGTGDVPARRFNTYKGGLYEGNHLRGFGGAAWIIPVRCLCRMMYVFCCNFRTVWKKTNKQKLQTQWAKRCPYGLSSQPAVLVLGSVHVPVKGVELTVAEVIHIHQVKLPPCIVVTLIVPFSGEIQPLGMAKLIPCNTESGECA